MQRCYETGFGGVWVSPGIVQRNHSVGSNQGREEIGDLGCLLACYQQAAQPTPFEFALAKGNGVFSAGHIGLVGKIEFNLTAIFAAFRQCG